MSFFWGRKGLIIPESQYGSPLYNHCFQQHCQQGVNGERERVGETGREHKCVSVCVCVWCSTLVMERCCFSLKCTPLLLNMSLWGAPFFPPFFLFKGLNREDHLFKAGFHTTHTHWNTPAHTLKSRDIFLLGNLSINQCDFKHIPQATRLT